MSKNTSNLNYKQADTHFFINEDRDLKPIRINLPECPDITKIDGYGLPAKEQKFTLQKYPQKLKKLEKECGNNIESIWLKLNQNQIFYKDEIKWIKKQWYYRLFGYWCFINGKPTYLDPWNFFYLNYWELDVGKPQYRDRDRRWFLAQRFAYEDTMDFVNKDEKGNAISEEDGTYLMKDTGRYLCWGTTEEKFRRAGDTSKALCIGYEETTRSLVSNMGIQAEVSSSAKKDFGFITHAWRKMPFFFQPAFDNPTNPQEKIVLTTPSQRGMSANIVGIDAGLESTITWATTANRGFYDGWKLLFYLDDEPGKCIEEDVVKRWGVVKKCLMHRGVEYGRNIGFSIHPSTVGDMKEEGGENFYELSNEQSNYYNRNENGETKSGLYNYYFRSTDGYEGFIDEYGMSMEEEARIYLQNALDNLLKENTEKSLRKYREEKRLMPMFYADCWQTDTGDIGMPYEKIDARLADLMFDKTATKRGNFKRIDNKPEGLVIWEDDEVNGKFVISLELPFNQTNRKYFSDGMYYPIDPRFIASGDTFRLDKTAGSRMSDGGGSVFLLRDKMIDPDSRDIKEWKTHRFVCTYQARPPLEIYLEDMLMMCEYFGAYMNPEKNLANIIDHFNRRGRGGYLFYGVDKATGRIRDTPGYSSLEGSKQEMFNLFISYMENHAHRERHAEILKDCKDIRGIKDMTHFDRWAAAAGCLKGASEVWEAPLFEEQQQGVNVSAFFSPRRV